MQSYVKIRKTDLLTPKRLHSDFEEKFPTFLEQVNQKEKWFIIIILKLFGTNFVVLTQRKFFFQRPYPYKKKSL